jgi:hypothetical protein
VYDSSVVEPPIDAFRKVAVLFGTWLMAGACHDRTTEIRPMASVPSALTTDVTHVAVSCDWFNPSSVCIEFVAKHPADEATVFERTGCKSELTPKPCRREARVGACRVS